MYVLIGIGFAFIATLLVMKGYATMGELTFFNTKSYRDFVIVKIDKDYWVYPKMTLDEDLKREGGTVVASELEQFYIEGTMSKQYVGDDDRYTINLATLFERYEKMVSLKGVNYPFLLSTVINVVFSRATTSVVRGCPAEY